MTVKGEKPQDSSPRSLDDQALRYLKEHGESSVLSLYYSLCKLNPSLTRVETADMICRLADQEKLDLEGDVPVTKSLSEFMKLWERNLWFYMSLVVSLAAGLAIYAISAASQFVILRWVFGSIFVIFIPGYVATEALFPGSGPDLIERLALSVGLSLALVSLVGLVLNFTPWGIRLDAIVVSLGMLTAGLIAIAFARRYLATARKGIEIRA